jgi:hypothetical protein
MSLMQTILEHQICPGYQQELSRWLTVNKEHNLIVTGSTQKKIRAQVISLQKELSITD